MSSRVFRGGEGVEAPAMVWRPANQPAGAAKTNSLIAFSNDADAAARAQAAYQQGLQEGRAAAEGAANQRAAAQLAPVLANLGAVIQELAGTRKRFRMEAEEATVNLAIAIARRVLHREIATDPEAILGLVKSAFERVNSRESHRLRVSPADAAAIQQNRAALELPPAVEIAADASLAPGSAIFETSRGELDASVTTQLEEIQRGFTDLVRRRMR
jgi:flagellar assembly protein FliH